MLASLTVKHFPKLLIGGFLWNVCRWAFGFLGAFLINDMTGSPRLVQLTGSFLWGPLLFAGVLGGALADKIDRRRMVVGQFVVLIPLTVAMAAALTLGSVPAWSVYALMTAAGFGWIIDLTSRRALIHDLVGPALVSNAMALEAISSSIGLIIGSVMGGVIIEVFSIGMAWFGVAGLMMVALVILWRVPSTGKPPTGSLSNRRGLLAEVSHGFTAARSIPALMSLLGLTVLVNFFHFAYFPITQVVATRLGSSPFLTGLLAAATGIGMLMGSLWVLALAPHRGRAYVLGSMGAFITIIGYGAFRQYILVFASLTVASFFIGWFSATQSALVLTVATDEVRGRAMGLLATSIGSLPIGMYALGEAAEQFGVTPSIVGFNLVGLGLAIVWMWRKPQLLASA